MTPRNAGLAAAVSELQSAGGAGPDASQPPSSARTLQDWCNDPRILEPPKCVIPYIAVEGRVTLLSGREKIGKSTFAACALAAASRGCDVLGTPLSAPIKGLWYALDEPVDDAVRRFRRLDADPLQLIINQEPRTVDELLVHLNRDLDAFPGIACVVVDTLSRVLAAIGVDPNSSSEVEPIMVRIVNSFRRRTVAAVLLYHTGKTGVEYRGSTAFGATVDEVLTLKRRRQADKTDLDDEVGDDCRRMLVQEGRHLRGQVFLTGAGGVYRLSDDGQPPRRKLLQALLDNGSAATRGDLIEMAGVRRKVGLAQIAILVSEGIVREEGHRLSTTPRIREELGMSVPEQIAIAEREPPIAHAKFPSSAEFPEGGTTRELRWGTVNDASSRIRNPLPSAEGTLMDLASLGL